MLPTKLLASESTVIEQWLIPMSEAIHRLNYRGTIVYQRDNKIETMRVVHAAQEGVEQERILSLNGPKREVVRNGNKVVCYLSDKQTVFVDENPRQRFFLDDMLKGIVNHQDQSYRFALAQNDQVAARQARIVSIQPNDDFRYARRIWIDLKSRLPLQYEVVDADQKTIERMLFTDLAIEDRIPAEDLDIADTLKQQALNWRLRGPQRHADDDSAVWSLQSMPAGFRQISHARREMVNSGQPVEHIMLSDGFSAVSIYVDEVTEGTFTSKEVALGIVNSYSRQVGKFHITVMGEVPAKTVRMIGDGVQYQLK